MVGLKKFFFSALRASVWSKNKKGGGGEEARAPLPRIRHWCYPTFAQLGPDPDCSEKIFFIDIFSVNKVRSEILNIEAVIIES